MSGHEGLDDRPQLPGTLHDLGVPRVGQDREAGVGKQLEHLGCVIKAYEAGANGIVVSREYEELTVPNLRAVGRAVRELHKTAKG